MSATLSLQGKVAFIQGGSRGIGAAIAKRLAREGAAVAFTYVASADKADALVSEITSAGGKALAIKADSADAAALQQAVRQAVNSLGNLDILVNNAGVLAMGSTEELPLEDLDRTLAVNVRSVFVASQEAARHMNDGGRIIN
ncbi:MAG: SDR family NAD(P)-dependent oxidoreductase, partial [Serratia proteamaculans]